MKASKVFDVDAFKNHYHKSMIANRINAKQLSEQTSNGGSSDHLAQQAKEKSGRKNRHLNGKSQEPLWATAAHWLAVLV